MHKKNAEERSIQYSRRVDAAVCVCALQVCAWETSHTALHSNNPERLLCWLCAFRQSLYRVLIREIEREVAVMHRRTLCENVDSAKIKVTFYTINIDILHVASMHRIIIHRYISIYRSTSMNRYTPIGHSLFGIGCCLKAIKSLFGTYTVCQGFMFIIGNILVVKTSCVLSNMLLKSFCLLLECCCSLGYRQYA